MCNLQDAPGLREGGQGQLEPASAGSPRRRSQRGLCRTHVTAILTAPCSALAPGLHPCRFRCKRILSSSSGPDTIVRRDVGEEGSKEWRTICVTVWGPAHHVELAGSWFAITSIPPDIPVAQVPLFTLVPQGCKSWAHHKGFL